MFLLQRYYPCSACVTRFKIKKYLITPKLFQTSFASRFDDVLHISEVQYQLFQTMCFTERPLNYLRCKARTKRMFSRRNKRKGEFRREFFHFLNSVCDFRRCLNLHQSKRDSFRVSNSANSSNSSSVDKQ